MGSPTLGQRPADLDGDGEQDILQLSTTGVHLLLNNGAGLFNQPPHNPVLDDLLTPELADWDGDGDIDIVGVTTGQDLKILLNDGSAGFSILTQISVGTNTGSLHVADMGGNGTADVVIHRVSQQSVSVFMTQVVGLPIAHLQVSIGPTNAAEIGVGDFNGDVLPDIFAARHLSAAPSHLIFNQGNSSFSTPVLFATSGMRWIAEASDVDGDGDLDLLLTGTFSPNVFILESLGTGNFEPAVAWNTYGGSGFVLPADFSGSGRPDLLVSNTEDQLILLRDICD